MIIKILIGIAIGAVLGGLMGSTRSCETGGCPLTATPLRGSIYGGFMGLLFAVSIAGGAGQKEGLVERRREKSIERSNTMSDKVMHLTEENFEETVKDGVTLVDFWAPWCGPCQHQLPILEVLADKVPEGHKVAKCNVDDNNALAGKFGVQSIPTLLVFKDGEVVKQFVGVQQLDDLSQAMKEAAEN